MDKYSFINGKKKKNIKKPAGNDQWSNAELRSSYGERSKSDAPQSGENVLISPFPESRKYDYGLNF
jgi:hypothetical protein